MKKLWFLLVILTCWQFSACGYESLDIINSINWARYLDSLVGYVYESHGCLHFSPADVQLLYNTIPRGASLAIKSYGAELNNLPFQADAVPYLADRIGSYDNLKKIAQIFKNNKTELIAYPSANQLFIMVNGVPYAKVFAQAGPPEEYLAAIDVPKGKPIVWDIMLTTPTDPGKYKLLEPTDHYISNAYYKNTVIPFGAWLKKTSSQWAYQKNGRWYKLPDNVAEDLARPANQQFYNYYDLNLNENGGIIAARYAGHDYGKFALLWTADGKQRSAELGYAAGELVFEQIRLIKELVYLLTIPGPDDFDACAARNENLAFYKELHEFIVSGGKRRPAGVDPALFGYYKLYNGWELDQSDRRLIDERALKAFNEYQENRLPRQKQKRWEALGLYHYIQTNSWLIDKQAEWYEKIKANWDFYKNLRAKLRADFDQMGVYSLANRQNIVEGWINDRLLFKKAAPPAQAKNVQELSFSTFFKPADELSLFNEREREIMQAKISQTISGEGQLLNLSIIDALNNYNFGLLLNEILGDLYRSHGCLHVSPRNMLFVYNVLPVGSRLTIYSYADRISGESLTQIPQLANLVNFSDDLAKIKDQLKNPKEVQIAVYPASGDWIIFLKDKPFARLRIKGGPQAKFNLLQRREKNGKPVFEANPAYPTTPGSFYIFKKIEDYVSNIYYPTTIIPMGGEIKKAKGRWLFQDKRGDWLPLSATIKADLERPKEEREYEYYDITKDASGETVAARWGSQPFGKFAIQTSSDLKNPWPELIHSSGDLMMEERQLIRDLILVLTAPNDQLDDCLNVSPNFGFYKDCSDFIANPDRTDLVQPREQAAYRLYSNLPLSAEQAAQLPRDTIIANKILKQQALSLDEAKLLIAEGVAYYRGGKLKINQEKVIGLQFDTYQYVVSLRKYAHHYEVLKKHWDELSGLRLALLKDFNNFVLKDVSLFHDFMRELMLKRNRLERLTQVDALKILNEMLNKSGQRDEG